MTRQKATQIARIWNEVYGGASENVHTTAMAEKLCNGEYRVYIYPDGEKCMGTSFPYTSQLSAFGVVFNAVTYTAMGVTPQGRQALVGIIV